MSKAVKLSRQMLRSIISEVIGTTNPSSLPEEVVEALPQLKLEDDPDVGYYVVRINRGKTRMYGGDRLKFVWELEFETALRSYLEAEHPDFDFRSLSYETLVDAVKEWTRMNDGIYYAEEKSKFNLDDAAELAIDSGSSLVVYDRT